MDQDLIFDLHIKVAELNSNMVRLHKLRWKYGWRQQIVDLLLLAVSIAVLLGSLFLALLPHLGTNASYQLPSFVDEMAAFVFVVAALWSYQSYGTLKTHSARREQIEEVFTETEAVLGSAKELLWSLSAEGEFNE